MSCQTRRRTHRRLTRIRNAAADDRGRCGSRLTSQHVGDVAVVGWSARVSEPAFRVIECHVLEPWPDTRLGRRARGRRAPRSCRARENGALDDVLEPRTLRATSGRAARAGVGGEVAHGLAERSAVGAGSGWREARVFAPALSERKANLDRVEPIEEILAKATFGDEWRRRELVAAMTRTFSGVSWRSRRAAPRRSRARAGAWPVDERERWRSSRKSCRRRRARSTRRDRSWSR